MASTQTPVNENVQGSTSRVVAFFNDRDDAYRAVGQLHDAGFTSAEIGIIERPDRTTSGTQTGYATRENESLWQRIKDFFSGDSRDADSYEDIDYDESMRGMDWERNRADYYYQGISRGGALVSVTGTRIQEARRILERAGGDLRESGFQSAGTGTASGTDERRIQLRGEVLRTYKERVQRGEVRLRKEVVTENQTISVPVTREELVVERMPGSGQRATGDIGTDEEVRVPLSEEHARVEKQPVVNEEVRVGKRAVQNTEQVSDNVRHEELRVDKSGDVDVGSDVERAGKRKKPAA